MSCGGDNQNFRLLDGFVGWDDASVEHLSGLDIDDAEGLRLAQKDPDAVGASVVLAYLLPLRLARGCGRCDWYLVTKTRLLRRDCCATKWLPVWSKSCDHQLLKAAGAVAARGHRVAVSDSAARKIWIWERDGEQLVASIDLNALLADTYCAHPDAENRIARPGPLTFTPWGELLVADIETNKIWRFGPSGDLRGELLIALPEMPHKEKINRLAASDDCSIWLVTKTKHGNLRLWRAARGATKFEKASIEQLKKAFKPTGLTAANGKNGFCIEECGPDGLAVPYCFDWDGEPLETVIAPPTAPRRRMQGQLLTEAIDSGIPRCRWHRVQIDADVPSGTMISVAVATSENAGELDSTIKSKDAGWTKFIAGVPHPLDWKGGESGALDFLIDQPPGRYLHLRVRLKGDGVATPVVRRVRLDFPRVTSLNYLPPVYRDNPEAEDFSERFLALFDASIGHLDRAIERAPALLDPEGVPDDVLPWLGSFLDVVFDAAWPPDLRRKILQALPDLYRRRGTIAGLRETIKLVFGVNPVIEELAAERNWGSVARSDGPQVQNAAYLGSVRLFGKSRARFRLSRSPLGSAPLRSYGNPDDDPVLMQAFRFRVLVPPHSMNSVNTRQRLEQLVASQKPAHALATIRFGGEGFILGNTSAVGVDTLLAALPPPVLGKDGNVRLRRMSLLWHGRHGSHKGVKVGETFVVGVQTIIE
ncbi:MAG: phage tail protein [Blastocatellia bacterium]